MPIDARFLLIVQRSTTNFTRRQSLM